MSDHRPRANAAVFVPSKPAKTKIDEKVLDERTTQPRRRKIVEQFHLVLVQRYPSIILNNQGNHGEEEQETTEDDTGEC